MKTRHWWLAGILALAACGSDATGPTPDARPARDTGGGGLMGSGTIVQPPPPRDSTAP
jgi:hypothetical protein